MWNYRVLKEKIDYNNKKLERFRIIEVYYDDNGTIKGWADCTHDILSVTDEVGGFAYQDLKGSAEHVLDAFKLPVVVKGEDDQLYVLGDNNDDQN
jgi:hypothetical protein